jgi:ABC-type multidrug transport system permease subunit
VIAKERRSGMYHLSAYYLAKTVSELPLVIVQPSFYLIISYWIIGLNGAAAFFGTWFIIITNSLVSQVKIDCH